MSAIVNHLETMSIVKTKRIQLVSPIPFNFKFLAINKPKLKIACKFISKSVPVQILSKINRSKNVKTESCPSD